MGTTAVGWDCRGGQDSHPISTPWKGTEYWVAFSTGLLPLALAEAMHQSGWGTLYILSPIWGRRSS